jgi:hypothetical protein
MTRGRPAAPIVWCVLLVSLWIGLQIVFYERFIYHDLWRVGFPILFSVGRQTTCTGLPLWLSGPDTGSLLVIYAINSSLTHLLRLPGLWAIGCFGLSVVPAMYLTKVQIIASYLALSGSIFVLGCVLFERRLSAIYLLVTTMYAGLFLDAMHSDQVIYILFWIPWMIVCSVLAHRHREQRAGGWYLNGAIFFLCLAALEQYPHFPLLMAVVGGAWYLALWPREARSLVRLHWWRLWPAAIVLLVTILQLIIVREGVTAYRPGANRELAVDPRLFDETGFTQPTALIGSFLPLGFLAGFERLAGGAASWIAAHGWATTRRGFIFRLDSLLFNLGFIPTVFFIAFSIRPGRRRIRAWWLGWSLVVFLVSAQPSRLYLVLFHLPFFDVFRAYFLYVVLVALALLVMSGYGVDAYLTLGRQDRGRLVRQSLGITAVLTVGAGACIVWLLRQGGLGASGAMAWSLSTDALLVAVGASAVWACSRSERAERSVWVLITILALSQAIYFAGAYRLVGVPQRKMTARYELDDADGTSLPPEIAADPDRFRRKECSSFAECYLSLRDTVTVRLLAGEWRTTFFRSEDDAIFQHGLALPVVEALSGVTHPVFWLSRAVEPYRDTKELVERLNAHREKIGAYLDEFVGIAAADAKALESGTVRPSNRLALSRLERGHDVVRLAYVADGGAILNAAITYDRHWIARVNGTRLPVVRGNFNGLAVQLPPGRGTAELVYRSWESVAFFGSRGVLLLVAIVVAGTLSRKALSRRANG